MIRELRAEDLPRLKQLEGGFKWEFDTDFMGGLVFVNEQDEPVAIVGAWQRPEVHLLLDSSWGTPGQRLAAFAELHAAMSSGLRAKGACRVVTWLDRTAAFCRRLRKFGWVECNATSWHRRLD